MKALLVYPEWPDTYWSFKHALPFEGKRSVFPPLGLLTVASMLPKTWEQRLVDINIRPVTDADLKWADVVMISAMLVQKDGMLRTLARCRELGRRTVVGGPISSCMADLPLYADHVVVGEAEELVAGLAADLEQGTAKPLYQARELPGLDHHAASETRPDQSEVLQLHGHPVFARLPVQLRILRHHRDLWPQAANQVARLRSWPNSISCYARKWRGSVFIVDDNFIGNKRKVKELLPVIAEWNDRHGRPFTFLHRGLRESGRRRRAPADDEGRQLRSRLPGHRDAGRGEPQGSAENAEHAPQPAG